MAAVVAGGADPGDRKLRFGSSARPAIQHGSLTRPRNHSVRAIVCDLSEVRKWPNGPAIP